MSLTQEERAELVQELAQALACATHPQLSDEELRWVKLAIEVEGKKKAFRDAVIEKTITGLIWLALLGVGSIFYEWAVAHGYKP